MLAKMTSKNQITISTLVPILKRGSEKNASSLFEPKTSWQRHLAAGFQRLEASATFYKHTSAGTRAELLLFI
jgi:hypothetical protein